MTASAAPCEERPSLAHELLAGLWLLERARGCNVYLVDAGGTLVLVDSGFQGDGERVIEEIQSLVPGRTPGLLVLTHRHGDHQGGASALRAHFGLRVAAGGGDCTIEDGRAFTRPHAAHRQKSRFARRFAARTEVDVVLAGEHEVAPGLVAVPVPGHTDGAYCYLDTARGVAFVGDLVISYPDGLARSMRAANDDDARYLESVREFARRAPAGGLAGHGLPVLEGFGAALQELAARPRTGLLDPRGLLRRARRLVWFASWFARPGRG
jgi:glyoxylase-like metal-dependent hydrolase (beta-lactamase superfamily II)